MCWFDLLDTPSLVEHPLLSHRVAYAVWVCTVLYVTVVKIKSGISPQPQAWVTKISPTLPGSPCDLEAAAAATAILLLSALFSVCVSLFL